MRDADPEVRVGVGAGPATEDRSSQPQVRVVDTRERQPRPEHLEPAAALFRSSQPWR